MKYWKNKKNLRNFYFLKELKLQRLIWIKAIDQNYVPKPKLILWIEKIKPQIDKNGHNIPSRVILARLYLNLSKKKNFLI